MNAATFPSFTLPGTINYSLKLSIRGRNVDTDILSHMYDWDYICCQVSGETYFANCSKHRYPLTVWEGEIRGNTKEHSIGHAIDGFVSILGRNRSKIRRELKKSGTVGYLEIVPVLGQGFPDCVLQPRFLSFLTKLDIGLRLSILPLDPKKQNAPPSPANAWKDLACRPDMDITEMKCPSCGGADLILYDPGCTELSLVDPYPPRSIQVSCPLCCAFTSTNPQSPKDFG